MEQILLHLIGDYITQTNWMANNKTKKSVAALAHATVYAAPFALITPSGSSLFVIWITHYLIDHLRLARYVVYFKNWITEPSLKWSDCSATGYPPETPVWMAVWLMIIADNTMHLCINYAALRWL